MYRSAVAIKHKTINTENHSELVDWTKQIRSHADSIRSHNFVNFKGPEILPQFYQNWHNYIDFIRPRIVKLQVMLFSLRLTQHVTLGVLQSGAPVTDLSYKIQKTE